MPEATLRIRIPYRGRDEPLTLQSIWGHVISSCSPDARSRPSYEDAGTHHVKGREQPVRALTALRVVPGVGGARRRVGLGPPFVGRAREFGLVVESATDSAERGVAGLVA